MARLKVAINGFGRIGRVLFRQGFDRFDIVGINNLDRVDGAAHLLKYDSTHGIWDRNVAHDEKHLMVDGRSVKMSAERDPAKLPWKEWGVDLVLECTGAFKGKDDFAKHLAAGAKRVMVSAPAAGVDKTIVYGVNHETYDPAKDHIISNASCTTNCLAPVAKVLHETFGIEYGMMNTIHSFTNDQRILDAVHSDPRRARTASASMIPTSTGAAKAVAEVMPELKGRLDGMSIRVPTQNVSVVDFTFNAKKDISVASINEALSKAAASGALKGILNVSNEPLVSIDYNGNEHSSTVDLLSTMVVGPRMGKILSWYDNETGFSTRMVDLALYMEQKGL